MSRTKNPVRFVVRPISLWPFQNPTRLSLRVWIRPNPQIKESEFLHWALSNREIDDLKQRPNWLSCEFPDSGPLGSKRQTRAVWIVKQAALALQIVAPIGSWEAQVMTLERRPEGLFLQSMEHRPPQYTFPWARIIGFDKNSESHVPLVFSGVQKAFARKSIRLINALNFFELGLEATSLHIKFFLWTTALDALLMAGAGGAFERRMYSLFGQSSFVLPSIESGQPRYRVEDVTDDLFRFRSNIAHGLEVPKKFWQTVPFDDDKGKPIDVVTPNPRPYHETLTECSLFLLCRLFRWIFLNNLHEVVNNSQQWRQIIQNPPFALP